MYLERKLYNMLCGSFLAERKHLSELAVLYGLIGQTRDIIGGKGERDLAYMQIYIWWHFYPDLALYAFYHFFYGDEHPWGSWKDINYFCLYVYRKTGNQCHPLILEACKILIAQLKFDETIDFPSLAAKWCPREKKKFGWLYNIIAFLYYPRKTPHTENSFTWSKMTLRKTIAAINRRLKTVEINMCENKLEDIEFENMPSIALTRYSRSFEKKAPKKTHQYREALLEGEMSINGRRSHIYDLIRMALKGSDLIEAQWEEYSRQILPLNCIPIVDLSSELGGEELYVAIGLAIIASEKHRGDFKDRVMIFGGKPEWVTLDGLTLKAKIEKLLKKGGGEANVYKPLAFISKIIKLLNMDRREVERLQLLIVTKNIDYPSIRSLFTDMPKIVFWNMGRGRVPCHVAQDRVMILSGSNPILLNTLRGNNRTIGKITPWSRLTKMVERYEILDKKIRDYFS